MDPESVAELDMDALKESFGRTVVSMVRVNDALNKLCESLYAAVEAAEQSAPPNGWTGGEQS